MENKFKEAAILVKKTKLPDPRIFPKFYELTYQQFYFFCHTLLKSDKTAKDAMQKIYTKIFTNLAVLQNDRAFIVRINKIAYSVCRDFLSRQKTDHTESDISVFSSDETVETRSYDSMSESEKVKALAVSFEDLDPILSAAFIFRYFDGFTLTQIAGIMDCSRETVKTRLYTAKKFLSSAVRPEKKCKDSQNDFSSLPIQAALVFIAGLTVVSFAAAKLLFEDVAAKNGLDCTFFFTAQPAPKPVHPSKLPTAAAIGGAVFVALGGVSVSATVLAPPTISNVNVHQPSSGFTNQAVSVTADVKAPLKTIKEIYLISDNGRKTDGTIGKDKEISFKVDENGVYTIHVITANNLEATAVAAVDAIDNDFPRIEDFTYNDTELVLKVSDSYSGIDFSSIEGQTEDNQRVLPTAFDEKAQTVTFDFPKEDFRLSLADLAGNISYHKIKRISE